MGLKKIDEVEMELRNDVNQLKLQKLQLEQQRVQLDEQISNLSKAIAKWESFFIDELGNGELKNPRNLNLPVED